MAWPRPRHCDEGGRQRRFVCVSESPHTRHRKIRAVDSEQEVYQNEHGEFGMKVGDKVRMSPMWKYETATGHIEKITSDGYIIVKWIDIPGQWHYTEIQAQRLEIINEVD